MNFNTKKEFAENDISILTIKTLSHRHEIKFVSSNLALEYINDSDVVSQGLTHLTLNTSLLQCSILGGR